MAGVEDLDEIVGELREWQHDEAPMQLHPGDLGWFRRLGGEALGVALRTWRRDGRILAIGLLDGPGQLRLATAPNHGRDEELAQRVVSDLSTPGCSTQSAAAMTVEVPEGSLIRERLAAGDWDAGAPWTPLHRDLGEPVGRPSLRIETVGKVNASVRAAVQRASFERSTFTEENWNAMAAGSAYSDARCLLGYDERDEAVAAVTVWSAGPGRPGLIEPMGVHREHRRRGYGRAITLAAAAALRELGSSSAIVNPSDNVGAVTTYRSAGFRQLGEVRDLIRVRAGTRVSANL